MCSAPCPADAPHAQTYGRDEKVARHRPFSASAASANGVRRLRCAGAGRVNIWESTRFRRITGRAVGPPGRRQAVVAGVRHRSRWWARRQGRDAPWGKFFVEPFTLLLHSGARSARGGGGALRAFCIHSLGSFFAENIAGSAGAKHLLTHVCVGQVFFDKLLARM